MAGWELRADLVAKGCLPARKRGGGPGIPLRPVRAEALDVLAATWAGVALLNIEPPGVERVTATLTDVTIARVVVDGAGT